MRIRHIASASATRTSAAYSPVRRLAWASVAVSMLVSLPLIAIMWSLPSGGLDAWGTMSVDVLPRYTFSTLALMVLTGILATLMGVSTAWLVSATRFPGRRILGWMLVLPLAVPAYIAAYIYADLFDFTGPVQSALREYTGYKAGQYWFPAIRSLPGGAMVLALVLYPYVYLLSRAAFAAQSISEFRAARTLGAAPTSAFFRIALPGARPAIAGGLALVLMETLADFGVAEFFGIPTFSTGIFRSWLALGDKMVAMKLAAVMLIFVAILVAVEAANRKGQVASDDSVGDDDALIQLNPGKALLALLACALPVVLGFLVPLVVLASHAFATAGAQDWFALGTYAADSVKLAVIVGLIASAAALLLAYSRRSSKSRLIRLGIRLSTLGYALPGALLAVGLLAPLGGFDQALTRFARDTFGWNGGLILAGTSIILIYALVVRFLTVSYNSVQSRMERIPPEWDAAARSLGAGPMRVVGQIHFPQLRYSLLVGGALVFIDTLRELPATLILRPFNLETLATRVYRLASDERLAEASSAALLILATGLIPVIILNRSAR